jgi:hypothetical protein
MVGDCTDTTNAMISMFRSLGYPAKGVEGYQFDKDHVHAWGEVLIDGKPFMIDQNGILQSLKEALELNHLIRPDETDPRNSMWDENGQARYQAQWWSPVTLAVDPATISDGQVGRDYPFTATVTGIGGTVTRVNFSWEFGAGSTRENEVNLPYKDPLTDETTHSFPDEGGSTVAVVLYDTTGTTPVVLARATVPVRMGASTPTAATGGWQLTDVVVDHYLDVGNGVSIEGNGRGGIASVETWSADGTSASARLTATWQIPDHLVPGSRVALTAGLALAKNYQTAGQTCADANYRRGPQDGSLDVTVLNETGVAPEFSDLVREVIRTGASVSVGCDTATRTVSAQGSAAGSFTVPDPITPAAGETAFLVVRFDVEHDSDRVRVAYIYTMPVPSPSASTDPCPPAAGGGPTCVQIAPDYVPGLSPTPSQ